MSVGTGAVVLLVGGALLLGAVAPGAATGGRRGTVKVPWDRFRILVVKSDDKAGQYEGAGGKCEVPAGRYSRYRITLIGRDRGGQEWELASGSRNETLEVRAGETTEIAIKPAFSAHIAPSAYRVASGGSVDISLEVRDAEGLDWVPPRPRRETAELRPTVTAMSAKEVLGRYPFSYG